MTMPANISPSIPSPRSVADKSDKSALLAAIRMALQVESSAVRHNTQSFNRGRYAATSAIPDYETLKDKARAIKEDSLARLPELLAALEASVSRNGGHFHLAPTAADASRYVAEVCREAGVRLVVKGKSMTSEEIGLNRALDALGIQVVETDLAEFILQVADEQPSHIIAPAIHYSRERITALFKRSFRTDLPLATGEELTAFARGRLREKFLQADAGITGANFIAADSGTLVLVESEANIRMASLLPPLHIAIAGVEKIVPSRKDFGPFLELLAASATGQPMTSYTSVISPPLKAARVLADGGAAARQFHLVLVDNGRLNLRQDECLREALYCIRCGACLNSCANFQTVGGHAFGGETYSGGIGGTWESATRGLQNARFSELCTGCSRCVPQCPVRIDIPWLNTVLRQRLGQLDVGKRPAPNPLAPSADSGASLSRLFFARYDLLAKWGSRFPRSSNWIGRFAPARVLLELLVGVDRRRRLPLFANPTLVEASRQLRLDQPQARKDGSSRKAVLFADVFTNYGSVSRGLAALRVLHALGVDVVVSDAVADGRAALSQGMIATAARQAERTIAVLRPYLKEGRDVVVVEPSVLAMFRHDYRHLLKSGPAGELLQTLRERSFEATEYVGVVLQESQIDAAKVFPALRHPLGAKLFYHSHCQQKTMGCAAPTELLLRAAGFDVITSQVECCGMAGSFGYKKGFYELSLAVAEDLFAQVRKAENGGSRILVASGISCQEQLQAGLGRPVFHPLELLEEILKRGGIASAP